MGAKPRSGAKTAGSTGLHNMGPIFFLKPQGRRPPRFSSPPKMDSLWALTFHCVTWKPHKKLNREVLPGKHHFPNLLIALLLTGRSLQSLNGEHETHALKLFTETTWWHIQSYQLSTLELSAINFHWCRDYYNFQVSQRLYLKVLILFATHLMLRHISVQGWNSIQRNSKDLAGANQWIVTVCNVLLLHWWEFHPILAFFCAYMLN